MKLKLERPIVFFDLETTGLDVSKDHILELGYVKVMPDGSEQAGNMRFRPVDALGNTVHIPEVTTAVHGISDADVSDCPTFKEKAASLYHDVFEGCDLGGFNSNRFDIPLLVESFLKSGVSFDLSDVRFVDVQNIFHKMEKRNLDAAYRFYCGKEMTSAHQALSDTQATYEVLQAQLDRYEGELTNDVSFLSEFSSMNKNVDLAGRVVLDDKGREIFTFGKYAQINYRNLIARTFICFGCLYLSGSLKVSVFRQCHKISGQDRHMCRKRIRIPSLINTYI